MFSIQYSNYRDLCLDHCLSTMDAWQRYLHAAAEVRICMPWDDNLRDSICDLGSGGTKKKRVFRNQHRSSVSHFSMDLNNPMLINFNKILLILIPIGAIAPIPFYFSARCFPLSFWRYVKVPILFSGVAQLQELATYLVSSPVSSSNYCIRLFHFRWWMRYSYILSAALDGGVALSAIAIFFTLQVWESGRVNLNWWGQYVS